MPHGAERVRLLSRVPRHLLVCEVTKQTSLVTVRTNPSPSAGTKTRVRTLVLLYPAREGRGSNRVAAKPVCEGRTYCRDEWRSRE